MRCMPQRIYTKGLLVPITRFVRILGVLDTHIAEIRYFSPLTI